MHKMASARSTKDPRELYVLKQKAVKYYEQNEVPVKMEEILNSMFYEDPPDVYGHLVNFFSKFTKPPTLSKLCAIQVVDGCGMPTIQTDVMCIVNNNEKLISSNTIPTSNIKCRPEDREKVEIEMSESIAAAIKLINSTFSSQLSGIDPHHQTEIDGLVLSEIVRLREEYLANKVNESIEEATTTTPQHPGQHTPQIEDKDKKKIGKDSKKDVKEKQIPEEKTSTLKVSRASAVPITREKPAECFVPGSEAVCAISQAVCSCAAIAHNTPLYRHISNIGRKRGAINEFRIPLPMMTIIQSGKLGLGKSNCIKEYMVVPGVNMSIDESIRHIHNIYSYVAKSCAIKGGRFINGNERDTANPTLRNQTYSMMLSQAAVKLVNEIGALCPTLDVPTLGLDLLQEAVNAQDLTIGEDIYLAINVSAHEFYDHEKGKYEIINGTFKTSDDLVEFWGDILTRYPSIVAIIDPIRYQDSDAWFKLCERISDSTYIVGDSIYQRPGILNQSGIPTPAPTSAIVLYQERMNSVSDILTCANSFQDLNNEIILSANQGDTSDTFIVDLAVGLNARFIKLGGPCRSERTSKLNRLLQIFTEMRGPEKLDTERAQECSDIVPEKLKGLNEENEEEHEKNNKIEKKKSIKSERTGEDAKSVLIAHTDFTFPIIQSLPPTEEEEDDVKEEVKEEDS